MKASSDFLAKHLCPEVWRINFLLEIASWNSVPFHFNQLPFCLPRIPGYRFIIFLETCHLHRHVNEICDFRWPGILPKAAISTGLGSVCFVAVCCLCVSPFPLPINAQFMITIRALWTGKHYFSFVYQIQFGCKPKLQMQTKQWYNTFD